MVFDRWNEAAAADDDDDDDDDDDERWGKRWTEFYNRRTAWVLVTAVRCG